MTRENVRGQNRKAAAFFPGTAAVSAAARQLLKLGADPASVLLGATCGRDGRGPREDKLSSRLLISVLGSQSSVFVFVARGVLSSIPASSGGSGLFFDKVSPARNGPMFPRDDQRDDQFPAEVSPHPVGERLLNRVRAVARGITDRVHATLAQQAPAPQPVSVDPTHPVRVLVVDDNPDAADALAAVAELLGYEARVCYGGAEAMDALRVELPDVLLLDLVMPRVDGLAVAELTRTLAGGRSLLVVATTALGSWEDRTETALAGFHFHLVKPIDITALRDILERFRALRSVSALDPSPHGSSAAGGGERSSGSAVTPSRPAPAGS
jgi:CheY-like chemotaxis protein